MSISNLYSSGQHKMNIGHFANIVEIAQADGVISEEEEKLLQRTARNLNIEEEDYKKILKNPSSFPTNPPVSYDERIERLYRLAKMIMADGDANLQEIKLLRKVAVGLSFEEDNAEKVCDEAIHLILNNNDLEDFTLAIKRVDSV